ncbi:MAG: flagellar motor switch protein FliG [Oscillospiraceae bacterium]|jgi:flagellar motor switch protein FliG|nr:flagellar motor switch protein FliG [Oscillospiraceae bacterium]
MAERAEITPLQKAALVISSLGAENASSVFKSLTDEEIEMITLEVAKMDYWPMEVVEGVLNDFYEMCLTQKVISEGGVEYAREVLEKAFGQQQAAQMFEKITKQLKAKSFAFVRKADYKNLLAIVQNEHPQTIALILSYARSDQSSSILGELSKDLRIEVVERMAKMDAASPDVVRSIEATLERKFASLVTMDSMEVGGVNYVAEVLNSVDRATEKQIFDELTRRDPMLAEQIRQRMFVFEDIISLDSLAIQAFLKEVDSKDLSVAIKGSTAEVAEAIYANMSSRLKESTQTDVQYLHNVKLRDVEEAQQRIVAIIRKLEDEGVLTISKGGGDQVIE